MAAKSKRASNRAQPLALELLTSDHRKVAGLFDQYEQEKDGDEDARRDLADRICAELHIHMQVEEELFYPWLRENLDDDTDLVEEAQVEHDGAKDLMEQIEDADSVDEEFNAQVKVLSEYITHHVKEEEENIFPKVSEEREALDELGEEMASRKAELVEEMGLEAPDDEEGEEGARKGAGRGSEERAGRR